MTNREAIKWLILQRNVGVKFDDEDNPETEPLRIEARRRIVEAYDLAIDALKSGVGEGTANCRPGDVVILNSNLVYGNHGFEKEKAIVLWNGFNGQPLMTYLDTWYPFWSTYAEVEEVVGHVDLEEVLKSAI